VKQISARCSTDGVRMYMSRIFILAIVAARCVLGQAALAGPERKQGTIPLRVEDAVGILKFGPFSPPQFSPDAKFLAYVVTRLGGSDGTGATTRPRPGTPFFGQAGDVVVLDIATGAAEAITGGKGNNWLPRWSPDGKYVSFLSDRDGGGQAKLWVWSVDENKLRKVSDVQITGEQVEWTVNSRELIVAAAPDQDADSAGRTSTDSNVKSDEHSEVSQSNSTVTVYSSRSVSPGTAGSTEEGPWSLDVQRRKLVAISLTDGRAETLVQNERITSFFMSPDGRRIVYVSPTRFENPGDQQILYNVMLLEVRTKGKTTVASQVQFDYNAASLSWSADSRYLCFRTGGPLERTNDCFVLDALDGTVREVSSFSASKGETRHRSLKPFWDEAGHNVYFLHDGDLWRSQPSSEKAERVASVPGSKIRQLVGLSDGVLWTPLAGNSTTVLAHDEATKADAFYRVDLATGEVSRLLERQQCYSCAQLELYVTVNRSGTDAVYFAEDAQHAPDLQLSDSQFDHPQRLTNLNPQFDHYRMGSSRLISWLSDDGELLHGALLLPSAYQEGKRYPLIAYVYPGGLLSDELNRFGLANTGPFNMQLFSTRGYAVLLPDSPQGVGTPLLDVAKTVLPGISAVVQMGIADPERIGLMGHSNGGYGTIGLLVQTKRFKAAVEVDGMADLMGLYGEMDQAGMTYGTSNLEHGQNGLAGMPWEVRERYIENSPIFYLDRVETPLLIVHGSNDTAVAPFLGDELFVDLRRLGNEVQYAKYGGEGHSPADEWSCTNQIDLATRMLAWFDKYLKPESPN
jgi:dipeptidyl aminopeptidase/acylaminoacyl peptidase